MSKRGVSRQISLSELASRTKKVYVDVLGGKIPQNVEPNPLVDKRLNVLEIFQQGSKDFNDEDLNVFLDTLLDAVGIVAASEGNIPEFLVGEVGIFGSKRTRVGNIYKSLDDQVNDWFFATLVQGWFHDKHNVKLRDLDLCYNFLNRKRICDFKIEKPSEHFDLLECKRVHPKSSDFSSEGHLIGKIHNMSEIASEQLADTQEELSLENADKHFLIDISQYHKESRIVQHSNPKIEKIEIRGFSKDEIASLKERINQNSISKVDRITLCWTNKVFINDVLCAVVHYTDPVHLTEHSRYVLDYGGWTIEGYPILSKNRKLDELRVSSTSRELSWIKASYLSCTDNLLSWGPEESKPED